MLILNKLVVVVVVLTRVSLQENTEMDVFVWRPKKSGRSKEVTVLTKWP